MNKTFTIIGNVTTEAVSSVTYKNEELPLSLRVFLGIVLFFIISLCLFGNVLVCMVVYRKPAMRSPINILVANLALSTILYTVFCMLTSFLTIIAGMWVLGDVYCTITGFACHFLSCVSGCILVIISFDRFLIIVRRRDRLNSSRAKVLILVSWCYSFVISCPPILGWSYYTHYSGYTNCVLGLHRNSTDLAYVFVLNTAIYFLPITAMAYAYVCIIHAVKYNTVKVHARKSVNDEFSISMTHESHSIPPIFNFKLPRMNVDIHFKTKSFKTILIIYLMFVVCWAPYSILSLCLNEELATNPPAVTILLWFTYANGAANPIIYTLRIKKFREACNEVFPGLGIFRIRNLYPRRRRTRPSVIYRYSESASS